MAISRGNSLLMKKQWAEDGSTVIPNPPVAGTTYRDESVDSENIAEGQQYDGVADSARWNQLLYIITGILKDTMAHGVLPWINTQDYSEGAVVMGSNGTLYIAKQANGPTAKNAKDPTTDSGESVWKAVIRLNDATMGLDSAGKILAKDIAIDGNVGDLASESGLLGTCKYIPGSNNTFNIDTDIFDEVIVSSSSDNAHGTFPNPGWWIVKQFNYYRTANSRLQIAFYWSGTVPERIYTRYFWNNTGSWTPWVEYITTNSLGDGIKNTKGILSVPEYEGATPSEPGTSGLVPPATVAERDKFLKGDGTYDIIGEDVYVKKTGDSMTGELTIEGSSLDYNIRCTNLDITAPPSRTLGGYVRIYDKNLQAIAAIGGGLLADGRTYADFAVYYGHDVDLKTRSVQLRVDNNGVATATCPSPSDSSNDSSIATTAWVNSKLGKSIMPVGAVYVQFANQPDPTSLFGGTWSNISNSYAGLFFRAEGGAAAAFGGSQNGGLPGIYGKFQLRDNVGYTGGFEQFEGAIYGENQVDRRIRCDSGVYGNYTVRLNASRSSILYGAANEVRPINSTIRIWKRTA